MATEPKIVKQSRRSRIAKDRAAHEARKVVRTRRENSLAKWIQEHMPWPYDDVDRDSNEARQEAYEMALDLLPVIERCWTTE